MIEFQAFQLAEIFEQLMRLETDFAHNAEIVGSEPDEQDVKSAYSAMTEAQAYCEEEQFSRAVEVIHRMVNGFEYNRRDYSAMATELRHARESIADELSCRMFVKVDTRRAPCPGYTELLGHDVIMAFPETVEDVMEASSCLIADCNTAAVFHLMRAVEWGLRALCEHLGLRRSQKRTKSGRRKYTPISYSDWETMLNQLQDKVDVKIGKMARGKQKQVAQEFYYPVLQDIRAIRDAWRNHVMHTRAFYEKEDADAILSHVRRLMRMLAVRLGDAKKP